MLRERGTHDSNDADWGNGMSRTNDHNQQSHGGPGRRTPATREAAATPRRRASRSRAFTLIEILIVVVILGIIATVVLPQFSNASNQARENTLKDELRYLRTQIVVYKAQHRDVAPGAGGGDFLAQLTQHTDEQGNTSATGDATFKYGPYLSRMPTNPLNGLATVEVSSDVPLVGDGSHGWVYNPETLEIIADLAGVDSNGTAFNSY